MTDLPALLGYLGFFAGIFMLGYSIVKKKRNKTAAIVILLSFVIYAVGAGLSDLPDKTGNDELGGNNAVSSSPSPLSGQLQVHYIDVGQGDAILIQTEDKNMLIDAGERGNVVVDYLYQIGVRHLDLVIATHPHADHIGGLINVIESFPVYEVIDPGIVHTSKTFEDYLTLIDEKEIKFTEGRSGMHRDFEDGTTMQILHPASPAADHLNDASIVTKVSFGQITFLFTGDIETESEKEILNRNSSLNSTILKIGHHGSRTSTSLDFLNAVNPEASVIMTGSGNRYGHPHAETLEKLAKSGTKIYRTDIHGTVVITTDGRSYDIDIKEAFQYNP